MLQFVIAEHDKYDRDQCWSDMTNDDNTRCKYSIAPRFYQYIGMDLVYYD